MFAAALIVMAARPLPADEMGAGAMGSGDMSGMKMDGGGADAMGAMSDDEMDHEHMPRMAAHMVWSNSRPPSKEDQERAEKIGATLAAAIDKYQDYRVAERDGFKPPPWKFKPRQSHFTNRRNALRAIFEFDPARPTSLLYKPLPDGGYKLIGAMYTAPRWWSEAKLDQRVPLSVARWHRHINLCFPPKGKGAEADWSKFGFAGSISTRAECEAAGGRFSPQLFGWMVHVYPWRKDPAKVWAH
jgi:hypothetical protein